MHIQQGMGRNTSENMMNLSVNMGETDYKFLCYHYIDIKFDVQVTVHRDKFL